MNRQAKLASALLIVGILCLCLGIFAYFRRSSGVPAKAEGIDESSKELSSSKRIEVPATQQWLDTGIDVTGKVVRIEYVSGEWSNGGEDPHFCDAKGFKPERGDGKTLLPTLVVRNALLGELVGKTDGVVFEVGSKKEGDLGKGQLYLSINDKPGLYYDNIGSITVIVSLRE